MDEPRSAGANRRTDSHFARASRAARQQEARNISTGQEQEKAGRAKQGEQRGPEESGHFVRERNGAGTPVTVGRLELTPEAGSERGQLGIRGLERRAAFEPGQRLHEMRAAAVLGHVPREPLPHVGVARKTETLRHDTRHRVPNAAQHDRRSDDRPIAAESIAPEAMADHRDRISVVQRLGGESGAQGRLDSDHLKEVRARLDSAQAQRLTAGLGEIDLRVPPGSRRVEDLRQRPVVAEVDRREPLVKKRASPIGLPQHREPIRLRIRKRPENNLVQDAEHRRRDARPQPEGQDSRQREPGRPAEQPPPEAQVLEEPLQRHRGIRR